MSIFIFSRPVRSGKTSALQLWCSTKKDIGGILMPDINGKRKIIDIRSGAVFDLEADAPDKVSEALVQVGRFFFYKKIFKKTNSILLKILSGDPEWVVIDEVGKLELAGKGFYPAVKKITEEYLNKKMTGNLLLVIRDSLCEEAIAFFAIKDHCVISQLDQI